jgi:hypothetical protein
MKPADYRQTLDGLGDALMRWLVNANRGHLVGSATVARRFRVPRSALERARHAGRVIAYQPNSASDFVYPVEQFSDEGIADWADDVIRAVENGAPALHLLYVPRESLGGESFAAVLRAPQGRDIAAQIKQVAARLGA